MPASPGLLTQVARLERMAPPIAARQCRRLLLPTLVLAALLVVPATVGAQGDDTNIAAADDEDVAANDVAAVQVKGDSVQKRAAGPKARCQPFQNRVIYKRGEASGKGVVKRDFGAGTGDKGELIFSDAQTGTGLFWTEDPGYVSVHIAALIGDLSDAELAGLLFEAAPGSMSRQALLDRLVELAATAGVTREQLFAALDDMALATGGSCLWTTRFKPRKADRDQLVPVWQAMIGTPPEEPATIGDGRFQAEVTWQDFDGVERASAQSFDVIISTDDTLGTFFDVGGTDLLVKLLDACADNGHFWVFASGTTGVEFDLTVTDTASGETKTYSNPLAAEQAVYDTSAFATCP